LQQKFHGVHFFKKKFVGEGGIYSRLEGTSKCNIFKEMNNVGSTIHRHLSRQSQSENTLFQSCRLSNQQIVTYTM